MAQAKSISLSQFTTAVQAAVKAAVQKHPKFKVDPQQAVTFSYLILGIPVAEKMLENVTFGEAQSFANDIAAGLTSVQPEAAGTGTQGAIYCKGGHVILGIPAVDSLQVEK